MVDRYKILSGLMGVAVGDALGVPVEMHSRKRLSFSPITDMTGYGVHNQPPGTWSDDSGLTFCLSEAIIESCNLQDPSFIELVADMFCAWYCDKFWTPHGEVFGIGGTTATAIGNLLDGVPPALSGSPDSSNNGNGSLMRTLPLAFCYKRLDFNSLMERVHDVSSITHAHRRSQIACGIYVAIAVELLQGKLPEEAYIEGLRKTESFYETNSLYYKELRAKFNRIFSREIHKLSKDEIKTSCYVINTLEASLWCFLNSSSYEEAVLTAVNLGRDTDTTAAVTGGLAGIYYGYDNIPSHWIEKIARGNDIIDLAKRLAKVLEQPI